MKHDFLKLKKTILIYTVISSLSAHLAWTIQPVDCYRIWFSAINSYVSAQSFRNSDNRSNLISNRSCLQLFPSPQGQELCHQCPNEFSNLNSADTDALATLLKQIFTNGFSCQQMHSVLGMPERLNTDDLADNQDNYTLAIESATNSVFTRLNPISEVLKNSIIEALRLRYSSGYCTEPTLEAQSSIRNRRPHPEITSTINCQSQRWDVSRSNFQRIQNYIDLLKLIQKTPDSNRQTQRAIGNIREAYAHDLNQTCLFVTNWRQHCEAIDSQINEIERLRATQNARSIACLCAHLQASNEGSFTGWSQLNIRSFGGVIPHPINAVPMSCNYYHSMPQLIQSTGNDSNSGSSSAASPSL